MGAARNRQEMRARSDGSSTCCLPGPGRDRGCLSAGRRPDGSSGPCYCDQACARTLDCCHDYARTCPAIPCVVSQWSAWSGCAEPCRTACRVRTRYIIPEPRNGGEACPALEERAGCVQYWTQQGTECQQSLSTAWSSGWCPWHSRPCMSGLGEGLRVCVECEPPALCCRGDGADSPR